MEEPKGFSIRYVWTAQVDGPALQSGLKSREYLTPYRPIIVSTPSKIFCECLDVYMIIDDKNRSSMGI